MVNAMDALPFAHNSEPRALRGARGKYRDEEALPNNIMHDPRVMRGSTYSQHNRDAMLGAAPTMVLDETRSRQRQLPPLPAGAGFGAGFGAPDGAAKKKLKWREKSIFDYRAPKGRGQDLDLSAHLVEREVVVATKSCDAQTDAFEPAPENPPYVPKKTGVDASTQMSPEDQPFDFDREVQPLLGVVTQKTLEQALLEVKGH
mmetsp:Transcript_21095/g.47586  ORF Transcript_21095/g.47586 Transcript_21095/m.47586 type:complete len:202 (+) Transcript_21095:198-803(+)